MSGKALLPGFGDDDDQEEMIAQTVSEVSALFKECERRLKEMKSATSTSSGDEVRAGFRKETPRPPPRRPRRATR